ncbi:phage portal protein [Lacticaseibacillus saniviri]|uniref:phage portal protein n=1 Tax=Lacticaseibacillus saniviri TaxID=931533 RepID=UPI001EDEDD94|nr:phage portal protein [Lacticaseibacillus saniviri]MCG4280848.1 phage portal protein [Lacticaseibacillus saniviri]
MGIVDELATITDHPKINIDAKEYDRIDVDRTFFEGKFPDIKYKNSYGEQQKRPYVSLNMLQVISRRLASLLYNEQSKITVDTRPLQTDEEGNNQPYMQPDSVDDFVQSVLADNDFNKNFERYLESCLALGGLAIRPYVDTNTGKIKLSWIQAPSFYPLRSNTNDIASAAIATPTVKVENGRNAYYTLLEFHEWTAAGYTITNELYRSETVGRVGIKVPLGKLYPDLAETTLQQGFSRPLFVYLKPAGFNNRNLTSPLGIGIADNARDTLQQINDAYDQFNWEVKMGQRRVAIPEGMADVIFDKSGKQQPKQVFDPGQNVYMPVPGDIDSFKITDLTTPIRSADYIQALNHFLKTLEMQVGLSSGTFSFDGTGLKTATEVVSENSMTYQTRNSHLTMVERAIKELVISICELGKATVVNGQHLFTGTIPTLDQISVDFDDGVFTDKSANADYWIKLKAAGVVPDWLATARVLQISDEDAKKMVAEVNDATTESTQPTRSSVLFGDGDA